MSSIIADSEFDEELNSSSCSYSWSSKDANEEAIYLVRRGKEICALIPGDKHIPLRGHLLTRLFVGESQEYSTSFVTRVKNYFRWKSHYQQLGSERGWVRITFLLTECPLFLFNKIRQNKTKFFVIIVECSESLGKFHWINFLPPPFFLNKLADLVIIQFSF